MPPTEPKLFVFDFNHIDPSLSEDTVEVLKKLYAFYHKKHGATTSSSAPFKEKTCFAMLWLARPSSLPRLLGGITLNPAVFATLTGFGIAVKAVASFKKYDKKAEKANFARVEYKKILDAIRFQG